MITAEKKIVIFRQYIRYYIIKSMHTYLYSIYIIKIMNLIMYHRNIYVNNHKFLLIIDNIIVLQLSSGLARSYHKNLSKAGGSLIIFRRCLKVSSKPGIGQKSCAFVCFASLQMLHHLNYIFWKAWLASTGHCITSSIVPLFVWMRVRAARKYHSCRRPNV